MRRPRSTDPAVLRLCLTLVRIISAIVPRSARGEWQAEWTSEFRHRHELLADAQRLDWSTRMDLVRRAFGALPDAAWIRRQFTTDSELVQDVRHGLRMLRRSPGFAATAIVILSIGIAGTTAVATLLDTLHFRALPYADAERVVTVWQRSPAGERDDVAPGNFLDWRDRSASFEGLAAVIPYSYDYASAGGEPEVFFGAQVTDRFFEMLGVRPLMGRTFEPTEHARGAKRVAIITHGLWTRRFNADPEILGAAISLDGRPYTVVGVLPQDFRPQLLPRPGELSVWTPKIIQEYESGIRDSAWWNVVGRLKPGVTLEQANSEMASIAAALAHEHPQTNERVGAQVISLREHLMGDVAMPLYVMLAAVLLVLLIGCANVSNLLLARGLKRGREFAIRAALGAGRARIIRQLVAEGLLLSVISAAAGVVIAHWLVSAIVALAPADVLRLQEAALDGRMVLFAVLLATLTALLFGLLPAFHFSRHRDGIHERTPSTARTQARRVLVVAEIALAVVLLVGAGLLIRSFERLVSVDPGFSPSNSVALQVFAHDRQDTPAKVRTFFRETLTRMAQAPGVEAVGAVSAMPFAMSNIDIRSTFDVVGRTKLTGEVPRGVYVTIATPGFFTALRVPLREGRYLAARDTEQTPLVSVISDSLRRREWPNESPIGRRIRVDWQGATVESEIVGVVSELRHERLDTAARPEVFFALDQVPFASMTYVMRGSLPPEDLIAVGRRAVWSVDPQQPFYESGAVEHMIATSVVRERFTTTLLSAVAGLALVLCAIGIYAVVSFATAQRTREIGVRMALGADRASIRTLVLREGALMVGAGIAAGLAGALATTRYLQTLLFEVRATDPLTLAGVCLILGAAALVACYVPAARATRVDPVVALRID